MGLFDGFSAGWDSFKNNELKTAGNVLLSPNPVVKALTNPQKVIENPSSLLPSTTDAGKQWEEVGNDAANTLLSPNPIISAVTGNAGDILSNKPAADKWDNVTGTVNEEVVKPIDETVVQPIIKETEKITETVKETVTNVTKGVGEALPVLAIGAAAVLGVSLLLGRR